MTHVGQHFGFAKTTTPDISWRRISFVILVVILIISWGCFVVLHMTIRKTQSTTLQGMKSIITLFRSSYDLKTQNIAYQIVDHFKNTKEFDKNTLLQGYRARYEQYCQTITHALCAIQPVQEELLYYAGFQGSKQYIILLQNSAEARPNGGFYGSFIKLTLENGMIASLSVHDSYEVVFVNSGVVLSLPQWTTEYLGHNEATFIAGNKFGFTDRDGYIISSIYNKTYNTTIDGIIFVSTDTVVKLIPSLQDYLWKRQFVNASVDLIRGENATYKKQLYLQELTHYLKQNAVQLVASVIQKSDILLKPGMVQVYLPTASQQMQQLLQDIHRKTTLQPQYLYLRDINHAENKIDDFVYKNIYDANDILVTQEAKNVLNLTQLATGTHDLHVTYTLHVPQRYDRYIESLTKQYDIQLTQRERHILGLDPLFAYRSVIFAGSGLRIVSVTGSSINDVVLFDAAGNSAATYTIGGSGNAQHSMTVTIAKE